MNQTTARAGVAAWLVALAVYCGPGPEEAPVEEGGASNYLRAEEPIADQYIVVLSDGAGVAGAGVPAAAAALVARHGGVVLRTYSHALRGFAARMSSAQARSLAQAPEVKFVEEDARVQLSEIQPGATWGLDRIDQRHRPLDESYGYQATGVGVTAYIIDTGIRTSHADFGGRAWGAFDAVGDGWGAEDCHGHGTHVAGTVGGRTWGVAKEVLLAAVRVLDCDAVGSISSIIAGVDWVTGNHVSPAVANMSLGTIGSRALDSAVAASIAGGVTYAVAAGNNAVPACFLSPARVRGAITVAASDGTDRRPWWSNYGSCVDLFAPGVDVVSAGNADDQATRILSGTSMATPHVAGAAALYLEGSPGASPEEVAEGLRGSATQGVIANPGYRSPNRLLYTGP